ncbi:Chaperonin Cpn60/TCP-1 family protein [Dioscorea alata]|uniref:Chaperonin Cpn60/TCP-1 family protein n=1 Tax=Dioscorea alata TaxID=55571 RepID=A0ACB7V874_DIOAL|nr:Chaperonin Cpn60/TCP-1 family protein [Dioscorea alata]
MQSPSAPIFQSLLQAESFGRRHRVEDAGVLCTRVDLVSKVVIKTNDFAGDGTTTASVLPCKIISLGCIVPPLNPVSIKKGIKNAQGLAKSLIRNLTCQLSRDVGISKPKPLPLSAGNDKFAGDMITDIINKVGLDLDGVFAIESSTLLEPSIHELGSYLCLFALIYRIE